MRADLKKGRSNHFAAVVLPDGGGSRVSISGDSWTIHKVATEILESVTKNLPTALGEARQSVAAELTKLSELQERGVIISDEFEAQKRRLLSM
jgi:hypothetical protein